MTKAEELLRFKIELLENMRPLLRSHRRSDCEHKIREARDLLPLPTQTPDRIEVTLGAHHKLCTVRAFRDGKPIYRRLIRKEQEAEVRKLLSSTSR